MVWRGKVSKRGSRGGGGGGGPDPPPWDLSEVGSCVEVWLVGEEVQRLCLPDHYQFFSGSLRSPVLYKHITCIHTPQVKWMVILFIYFLYPNYEKNQLPLPCFYDRTFLYFSCLNLHDFTPLKQKIFWGRTPRPPPRHILLYKNYHVIRVFCVKRLSIVQKTIP